MGVVDLSQEALMAALSHLVDHKARETNFVGMGDIDRGAEEEGHHIHVCERDEGRRGR
jgi:hypothetical protein